VQIRCVRTIREKDGKELVSCASGDHGDGYPDWKPGFLEKSFANSGCDWRTVEQVSEVEIALAKAEKSAPMELVVNRLRRHVGGCEKAGETRVVKPNESVVLVLTGHVLKDPDFT
jgi:threonine synthase